MITVALIGPDGAGKTTISERLVHNLGVPVKRIYMGVNLDSSSHVLPTTRLLARFRRTSESSPVPDTPDVHMRGGSEAPSGSRRVKASLRRGARLGVWLSEEWFRQLAAWYYVKLRGHVVVFDRHFYVDYLDQQVENANGRQPWSDRAHLFLLEHVYPKPDLVICLDAPAEVLYERKPETALDWLRRRREEYLALEGRVPRFATVDATRPTAEVARDVANLILRFREERGATPRVHEGSQRK